MKALKKYYTLLLGLILITFPCNTNGKSIEKAHWAEYKIDVSQLPEEQLIFVEETLYQLKKISPGKIKINQRVYKRLSRFEELFGFPFHGERLTQWLLRRIESISYKNSWTVATNQNKGELVLGDRFFSELNLVERLYLLIHEGRHSDDEGHKHVKCPKGFNFISAGQPGMNLENENACDKGKAGAYSYQAAFLFELYAFGIFNQREMGLLYNSSISRIRD